VYKGRPLLPKGESALVELVPSRAQRAVPLPAGTTGQAEDEDAATGDKGGWSTVGARPGRDVVVVEEALALKKHFNGEQRILKFKERAVSVSPRRRVTCMPMGRPPMASVSSLRTKEPLVVRLAESKLWWRRRQT